MAYILSLLPLVACPIGMGLMMWMMMRHNTNEAAASTDMPPEAPLDNQLPQPGTAAVLSHHAAPRTRMGHICLNWKVIVTLAVVGVGTWIFLPNMIGMLLPLLLVVACPLSMLLMMRGTHGSRCAPQPMQTTAAAPLTNEQHLAQLRDQQAAIAHQITELEAARGYEMRQANPVAPNSAAQGYDR